MKPADHRWFEEPNWVTKFNADTELMRKEFELKRLLTKLNSGRSRKISTQDKPNKI